MDKAVKESILRELDQELDLTNEDRENLIEMVEGYEQEIRDLMTRTLKETPDEDPEELVNVVLEDFVRRGRLDERHEVLWDTNHEMWRDLGMVENQMSHTIRLWMNAEWVR